MAALVSESWITGRELEDHGLEGRMRSRATRKPRSPRAPRLSAPAVDPWLGGQNNVATDIVTNNSPLTNANKIKNRRNRGNSAQDTSNNSPQRNTGASQPTQSQSQSQGRNRNRNRNRNRGRQKDRNEMSQNGAIAGLETSYSNPEASRSRQNGPNNRDGRRQNQSNSGASNNLTIDPVTGEVISRRAAKRRQAKARKAAAVAREETVEQTRAQQQPRVQTQPPSAPSTSASRTANYGIPPVSAPGSSASVYTTPTLSRSSKSGTSNHPSPRSAIATNTIQRVAHPTSCVSSNRELGATAPLRIGARPRWTNSLDERASRTTQPITSTTSANNTTLPSTAPSWRSIHQAHTGLSSVANRNQPGLSTNLRPDTAAVSSIAGDSSSTANRPTPALARTRFSTDFIDSDAGTPQLAPPARSVRVPTVTTTAPTVPVSVPPLNITRRAPTRTRPSIPCTICLDIPDEFPRQRPTTRCIHPINVCASCLEQHISHAVLSQGSTTLTCPDTSCRQNLEYADVIRATKSAKTCQDRYEALLLRRTLETEPNFVWCKNPGCDWGQVHESGVNAPIVICQVCRARSCFTHNVPWHTGLTCSQYATQHANRERENRASEAYISLHAKQCPNSRCGRRIEKNDGCDHMTCRRPAGCGHEFCWVCLADYQTILREGNHRHATTCQHYAPIRRTTVFEDYYRQELNRLAHVPPQPAVRPQAQARHEPPPPPQPMQQTQREQGPGSVWSWLVGAAAAVLMLRG
ncbi:unnamed protein product [Rhizoctonia solani]|uniref:RBR-type E3 ubiquitin transferase n=1 Tax=Rhizoctonia solani TaxID=456999 RepID=A0A8H3BTZ2_9AGAM|nr:unnamed protein product [Rhizoctonia solani]